MEIHDDSDIEDTIRKNQNEWIDKLDSGISYLILKSMRKNSPSGLLSTTTDVEVLKDK